MAAYWQIGLMTDDTPNSSNKGFQVPQDMEWQILWIWVKYVSSVTPGSRQLEIQLQDENMNPIAQWQTRRTQDPNTNYKYLFGTGIPDLLNWRDYDNMMTPMLANTFLCGGQILRVWDNNSIDSSGDNMIIQIEYGHRSI
jgi:hypothetical protein